MCRWLAHVQAFSPEERAMVTTNNNDSKDDDASAGGAPTADFFAASRPAAVRPFRVRFDLGVPLEKV